MLPESKFDSAAHFLTFSCRSRITAMAELLYGPVFMPPPWVAPCATPAGKPANKVSAKIPPTADSGKCIAQLLLTARDCTLNLLQTGQIRFIGLARLRAGEQCCRLH